MWRTPSRCSFPTAPKSTIVAPATGRLRFVPGDVCSHGGEGDGAVQSRRNRDSSSHKRWASASTGPGPSPLRLSTSLLLPKNTRLSDSTLQYEACSCPAHHSERTGRDRDAGVSRALGLCLSSSQQPAAPSSRSRRRAVEGATTPPVRNALTSLPSSVITLPHSLSPSPRLVLVPLSYISTYLRTARRRAVPKVARLITLRETSGAAGHWGAWPAHLDDRPPGKQGWRDLDQACCQTWSQREAEGHRYHPARGCQ